MGGPLFLCVIGIGFYFTVRLKFFQIINLKEIYRNTIGTLAGKINKTLLARQRLKILKINRGGCHCAIRLIRRGNDRRCCCGYCGWRTGAIFWMWIIAVVGMMTKMVEVTLAVKYRSKGENGEYYGGPMHYIKKGLNKNGIPGRIICVCINDSGYYGCLFCAN